LYLNSCADYNLEQFTYDVGHRYNSSVIGYDNVDSNMSIGYDNVDSNMSIGYDNVDSNISIGYDNVDSNISIGYDNVDSNISIGYDQEFMKKEYATAISRVQPCADRGSQGISR
jgi:hypothetical protein